ncbi:autism susceptibility gene 2 protein homolog isoform X3 [Onychostoma macrolepis]|nr:autism susceptibility gene 2 protein homolog isoform X3 [Onychostoma macrolepis]
MPSPAAPLVRSPARQFDKYPAKMDTFHRHNLVPSYPSVMTGIPPMVPPAGPFSSLQGAFQPKASNPLDVVSRPGSVPHQLLQKDSRLIDPMCPKPKKPGKWCAMHVHIAWQVYHHQQKMKKQMQIEPHKLDFGFKPEFLNRSPGSSFMGLQPRDLPRPSTILSNAGPTHPSVSPYGHLPHTPNNLHSVIPHHESLNKPLTFGGLSTLSSSAFGGLGNPSITPNAAHGTKDGKTVPTSSGQLENWNRLHQTPSSFPTPPLCPRPSETERAPSIPDRAAIKRDSLDKDDKEREPKEKSNGRHLSPIRNSALDNKQPTESFKSSSPDEPKEEEQAREKTQAQELPQQTQETEEPKHKEIQSDKREKDVKSEQQQTAEDKPAGKESSSPKQQREDLKRPNSDRQPWEPAEKKIRVEYEPHAKSSKVRVKEEKRDDQDHEVTTHQKVLEKPWQDPRTPAINPSPLSTLPLPIGIPAGHPGLDRIRLVSPFLGMGPLPGAERLPYSPQHWESMRNVYRGLDLPRRDSLGKDLLIRTDSLQRAMMGHPAYPREPFLQSMALEQRSQLEERHRLAFLREESERSRLLAMHHTALDHHLPPPGLLTAAYPSTGLPHYSSLSRTLPAAYLHAQPHPLFPMLAARPGSPRRMTPLIDRPVLHPHRDTETR